VTVCTSINQEERRRNKMPVHIVNALYWWHQSATSDKWL